MIDRNLYLVDISSYIVHWIQEKVQVQVKEQNTLTDTKETSNKKKITIIQQHTKKIHMILIIFSYHWP
jgi:hypothetical protein